MISYPATWLATRLTATVLLCLVMGLYTQGTQADTLIDHVTTRVHANTETVHLFFNQPVQYLYHTPQKNTQSMLLGFYINRGRDQSSRSRPVAFKKIAYLSDLELFYENGFNPHLYLEFNQTVDVTVDQDSNSRGFIITINKSKIHE